MINLVAPESSAVMIVVFLVCTEDTAVTTAVLEHADKPEAPSGYTEATSGREECLQMHHKDKLL